MIYLTKLDGNEGVGVGICRWCWKQICKFETAADSANSPPQDIQIQIQIQIQKQMQIQIYKYKYTNTNANLKPLPIRQILRLKRYWPLVTMMI